MPLSGIFLHTYQSGQFSVPNLLKYTYLFSAYVLDISGQIVTAYWAFKLIMYIRKYGNTILPKKIKEFLSCCIAHNNLYFVIYVWVILIFLKNKTIDR